jgi:acyl-CoA:acyl-CoA alkyltransferase
MRAVLRAHQAYLPTERLSSDALEARLAPLYERLKLPFGRLELMSGIRARGLWPVGTKPSTLATMAARSLFETHDINPDEVDLLIHASVCRDFLEPATASVVHANLGLKPHTPFFDLSNACLGVLSATELALGLIKAGQYKNILIVSGENAGPLIETTVNTLLNDEAITRKTVKKYMANLTIGSGAVAWLVSAESEDELAPLFLAAHTRVDSEANVLCQGSGSIDSLVMETDSEALLQAGVRLARQTWDELITQSEFNQANLNWVIGHQVGEAHERAVLEALALNHFPTHRTYPTLGNTGSAALPLTLFDLAAQGLIKNDEAVALIGIGSGLASTMLLLQWRTP